MIKLFFFVNIVIILILILFFSKTISISKGTIVKVRYTKSGLLSKMIGSFVFSLFIIYIFYTSNSYSGWSLLISIPFTAIILYPFFGFIKTIKSNEILLINSLLNTIIIEDIVYDVKNISNVKIVKRIGQNSMGTNDYVISLITYTKTEVHLITLEYREDAILLINKLCELLNLPLECYKDGGLLGIIQISKNNI